MADELTLQGLQLFWLFLASITLQQTNEGKLISKINLASSSSVRPVSYVIKYIKENVKGKGKGLILPDVCLVLCDVLEEIRVDQLVVFSLFQIQSQSFSVKRYS